MNKNKKCLAVLSSAALGVLIASAVTSTASAKTTGYVAKDAAGKVISFDLTKLIADYTNNMSKLPSPMFDEYLKDSANLVAFQDDKTGLVSYDSVLKVYIDAMSTGKPFVLDTVTEAAKDADLAKDVTVGYTCDATGAVSAVDPTKQVVSVTPITATTNAGTVATLPTTVKVTLGDKTTVDAKITWNAAATAAATYATAGTVTVNGTLADYGNYPVSGTVTVSAAPTALSVSSVSATNLHQVSIVFNGAVDKTSAELASNYTISGLTVDSAAVQADGKTVVLNVYTTNGNTAAFAQATDYTVTTQNVKNTAGVAIAKTSSTFTANDSTIPTVKSVEALGNKALRVTFSEPVKAGVATTAANYAFVGESVAIGSVTIDDHASDTKSYTVATVNLSDTLTPGTHKFRVNGTGAITDFGGYAVAPQDNEVNVTTDVSAPTVSSATASSRTTVYVNFAKGVTGLLASDVLWNTDGSTSSGIAADSISKVSDTQYKLTFTTSPLSVGTDYIVVKNTNVADYSGNKMAANAKASVTIADESAPTVTSVTAKDDKTFYVYYSKSVLHDGSTSAADYKSNYTFYKADGTTVLTSTDNSGLDAGGHPTATITWNSDENMATVSLGANALPGGKYNLKVANVKDLVNQTMTAGTTSFTVADTTAPTFSSYNASASTLVVNFNEPMATTGANSIGDASNYKVKLASRSDSDYDVFPSGTTFTPSSDAKSVTIKLPTGGNVFATNDDVEIGYIDGATVKTVADASGNLLAPDATSLLNFTVGTTQDDISSASTTLKVTSPTTLELAFPSTATKLASVYANDFKVTKTGEATFAAASIPVLNATLDSTGRKITLTISDANKFTSSDLGSVALFIDSTAANVDSKDVLGLKLLENVSKAVSSNNISATIKGAELVGPNDLRVTFDSAVDSAAGNLTTLAKDHKRPTKKLKKNKKTKNQ